jgi:hypothetical protein
VETVFSLVMLAGFVAVMWWLLTDPDGPPEER